MKDKITKIFQPENSKTYKNYFESLKVLPSLPDPKKLCPDNIEEIFPWVHFNDNLYGDYCFYDHFLSIFHNASFVDLFYKLFCDLIRTPEFLRLRTSSTVEFLLPNIP